ncbi:ferritin-like domain-containing protein [Diaminobutyricibacter sp. McL0618]|uniref:YciE/YciF ferroxidase family protein n=1 Tax=Leifsonia sp. McL0618 TaxID=3415677 RepID=UPI003CF21A02
MFEHFDTQEEVFGAKLSAALTMEHDSLDMLVELQDRTQRWELRDLFHAHASETRQQIDNIERCFQLLEERLRASPSPATKGLAKESRSMFLKTDDDVVDSALLAGALETELYEIGVYQSLITIAETWDDADDVVRLLTENLQQEVAASEKIQQAAEDVAAQDSAARET